MTDEQAKISEAFERFLNSYLSRAARQQITDSYGEEIAAQVKTIYDAALGVPVDWRTATIDTALPVLHELLNRDYSWLSDAARRNINYAFILERK